MRVPICHSGSQEFMSRRCPQRKNVTYQKAKETKQNKREREKETKPTRVSRATATTTRTHIERIASEHVCASRCQLSLSRLGCKRFDVVVAFGPRSAAVLRQLIFGRRSSRTSGARAERIVLPSLLLLHSLHLRRNKSSSHTHRCIRVFVSECAYLCMHVCV